MRRGLCKVGGTGGKLLADAGQAVCPLPVKNIAVSSPFPTACTARKSLSCSRHAVLLRAPGVSSNQVVVSTTDGFASLTLPDSQPI